MFESHLHDFASTKPALFKLAFFGCLCLQEKKQNQKPTSQDPGSSTEPNYRNIFSLTLTVLFSTVKNNKWKILETYVYNKGRPRRIGHKWQCWTSSRVSVMPRPVSFPPHISLPDTNTYQHRLQLWGLAGKPFYLTTGPKAWLCYHFTLWLT